MPTTSNFGWTTPADTDLVKDGAAAIRTLGNGVDASLVDLKGGTTGQILSKASNTDLDYTWIANDQGDITEVSAGTGISVASGTGPVPVVTNTVATTFDAKGDLVVGTGADTFAKLAVGTNGYTLVADSSVSPTGLKWAAPVAGGGLTLLSTTTLSGSSTTVSSISGSYKNLILVLKNVSANDSVFFRLNGDTGSNYYTAQIRQTGTTLTSEQYNPGDKYRFDRENSAGATNLTQSVIRLYRYTDTDVVYIEANTYSGITTSSNRSFMMSTGIYDNSAAVDSVTILPASSTITGTLYIYGES